MIAATYPIGIPGRIGALNGILNNGLRVPSPILVGAIAVIASGPGEVDGWRWGYYLLGVPVGGAAISSFFLKEPERGRGETTDGLGESVTEEDPLPVSTEAAFSRLMQIRTVRMVVVAFSALGFGLFTAPVLENLFLEDDFGLDAFERGVSGTAGGVFAVVVLIWV